MARYNNHVKFVGNLGGDPELKIHNNGERAAFSLAVQQGKKDDGKPTMWFNVAVWNNHEDPDRAANVAGRFKRGDRVQVEGHFEMYEYVRDGVEKQGYQIVADSVEIFDGDAVFGKGGGNQRRQQDRRPPRTEEPPF